MVIGMSQSSQNQLRRNAKTTIQLTSRNVSNVYNFSPEFKVGPISLGHNIL